MTNNDGRGLDSLATQTILWGALLASVAMYGVVGSLVPAGRGALEGGPPQVLVLALVGVAVMSSGLALFLPALLTTMPAPQRNVVRWAIAESVGVLGVVLHFLGAGPEIFFGFVGWSALLLLVLRPRSGVEEKRVS
jgi:hypothetical protein